MTHDKRIRQLAPVRVSEDEEIALMRYAATLDRPLAWVRRAAYREYILAHGGTVGHDAEHDNEWRASQRNSSLGGTDGDQNNGR